MPEVSNNRQSQYILENNQSIRDQLDARLDDPVQQQMYKSIAVLRHAAMTRVTLLKLCPVVRASKMIL